MNKHGVKLLSKSEDIKWPRYEITLEPGLSYKDATSQTLQALKTKEKQVLLLSQFKYDPASGIVDTRINRSEY